MSEFLLVGTRLPVVGDLSPTTVARDLTRAVVWQRWLRRWGVLRAVAVHPSATGPSACLIVRASGLDAALRMATGWERATGYLVAVLPLVDVGASSAFPELVGEAA